MKSTSLPVSHKRTKKTEVPSFTIRPVKVCSKWLKTNTSSCLHCYACKFSKGPFMTLSNYQWYTISCLIRACSQFYLWKIRYHQKKSKVLDSTNGVLYLSNITGDFISVVHINMNHAQRTFFILSKSNKIKSFVQGYTLYNLYMYTLWPIILSHLHWMYLHVQLYTVPVQLYL